MSANISPIYFTLYAIQRRSGMADNGYYHQQPFYSPPILGDVMTDKSEPITDDDWSIATAIATELNRIRHVDKRHRVLVEMLDIWEGAYKDAPLSRHARCKQNHVKYDRCKKAAARCKNLVEKHLYG